METEKYSETSASPSASFVEKGMTGNVYGIGGTSIHAQPSGRFGMVATGTFLGAVFGVAAAASATVLLDEGVSLPVIGTLVAAFTLSGMGCGLRKLSQSVDKYQQSIKTLVRQHTDKPAPKAIVVGMDEKSREKHEIKINTLVFDGCAEMMQTDTYPRDRVVATGKQVLLSMDHTKAISH